MGEVPHITDTKLSREVTIKILPPLRDGRTRSIRLSVRCGGSRRRIIAGPYAVDCGADRVLRRSICDTAGASQCVRILQQRRHTSPLEVRRRVLQSADFGERRSGSTGRMSDTYERIHAGGKLQVIQ
jgi:hypothetical protein